MASFNLPALARKWGAAGFAGAAGKMGTALQAGKFKTAAAWGAASGLSRFAFQNPMAASAIVGGGLGAINANMSGESMIGGALRGAALGAGVMAGGAGLAAGMRFHRKTGGANLWGSFLAGGTASKRFIGRSLSTAPNAFKALGGDLKSSWAMRKGI